MKVIDLLNKIANGEEVPEKIQWGEFILVWEEQGFHDYKFLETGNHLLFQGFATSVLNNEVEIIEEDKKIYKLDWVEGNTFNRIQENSYLSKKEIELLDSNFKELGNKINEIIDKLNAGEDKE